MELLLTVLMGYALMVVSWLLFLAVMNLKAHRDTLHPVAKAHAYLLLAVGLVVDLALTVVVGSILYLDPPREWTLTGRLKRYRAGPDDWRKILATWICEHLLNQFDPGGNHC